jgi:hypothetical protein
MRKHERHGGEEPANGPILMRHATAGASRSMHPGALLGGVAARAGRQTSVRASGRAGVLPRVEAELASMPPPRHFPMEPAGIEPATSCLQSAEANMSPIA